MSNLAHATLAYGTGIAFLLIGGAGLLITYSITRPLNILADGAAPGSVPGDYTHRVVIKSRDEVGDLSRHFNQMAEQVQERQNTLAEQGLAQDRAHAHRRAFPGPARSRRGLPDGADRARLAHRRAQLGALCDQRRQHAGAQAPGHYAGDNAPEQIAPGRRSRGPVLPRSPAHPAQRNAGRLFPHQLRTG